jgi:uncharacterized protein YjbI with pentapeptide repeats
MEQEQRSAGQEYQAGQSHKKPRILLWVAIIATLALVLGIVAVIAYGYAARPGWVGVSDKLVWDYLELLIVPAVLAIGAAWLSYIQSKRAAREAENAQQERERNEEKQRLRELRIASLRAQDEALQGFLGHMSELLMNDSLDKRLRDVNDRAGDNLRVLARARTLTVLGQLEDGDRKGSVLQFLYEADLITWVRHREGRSVLLARPNQGDRNYIGVIDLSGADLGYAELRNAFLHQVALGSRYDAPGVYLWYAKLSGARLGNSLLHKANLSHAVLSRAFLAYSDLTEVTAIGANLRGANLIGADLTGADLTDANLSGANLFATNFSKVDLRGANLSGAEGIDVENLEQQASLKDATMPDGSIHP